MSPDVYGTGTVQALYGRAQSMLGNWAFSFVRRDLASFHGGDASRSDVIAAAWTDIATFPARTNPEIFPLRPKGEHSGPVKGECFAQLQMLRSRVGVPPLCSCSSTLSDNSVRPLNCSSPFSSSSFVFLCPISPFLSHFLLLKLPDSTPHDNR